MGPVAGTNWAGTHTYRGTRLAEATSVAQVQEAVAASRKVRALGTRHSFNDIADSDETLVTVIGIPPDPLLDVEARTVAVGGGVRYGDLAAHLQAHGWALHNLGSLPHISVAGAVATGTHGSGDTHGILATAVRALELVAADGSLVTLRQGDPGFPAAVVSLGALGVVVRVTLAVEPSYAVRQDAYLDLSWDAVLDGVGAVTGAAYSVSLFTDWSPGWVTSALVKRRLEADEPAPEEFFGGRLVREEPGGPTTLGENATVRGVLGPWCERLPHFRMEGTPSVGEEIQSELFVAREDGPAALRAVRAVEPRLRPHLTISELRTVAADDLALSPAYGRDSLAFHFTWKDHPAEVHRLVPEVERALAPYSPRPHWGKVHTPAADWSALYPRLGDFRELVATLDPRGKFANAFVRRVLGRS